MASGTQFQSAIVFAKNENLKTSLFAYGTRNLNWWLPLVRLSECWIKYFRVSVSIRPWVSLYISVNLDCLLLVFSVAHPKSLIMSVTLAYHNSIYHNSVSRTVLLYVEPFPEHWYLSLKTITVRLFFNSNKVNQVNRRMTVDNFKSNKKYFKTNTKFDRKPM